VIIITFVRTFFGSDDASDNRYRTVTLPVTQKHSLRVRARTPGKINKLRRVEGRAEPRGTVLYSTALYGIRGGPGWMSRACLELCGKRKRERGGALHVLLIGKLRNSTREGASPDGAEAVRRAYSIGICCGRVLATQCQPCFLAPLCLLKSLVSGPPPPLPVVKQTYICDAAPATSHPCFKNPWSCHQLHLPPSHRPTGNSTVSFVIRSAVSLSHLNSAVPPYPTKTSSPSSVLTSSLTLPASSTPDVRVPMTIFYSTFSGLGRPRTHAHALDGYEIFARIYKRPICLSRNEGSLFLEGSRNSLVCC
jgi:hypothetical protein